MMTLCVGSELMKGKGLIPMQHVVVVWRKNLIWKTGKTAIWSDVPYII